MVKLLPASTLRQHLSDVLKEVGSKTRFVLVTRRQKPVSALVNIDFFEDLLAATSPSYLRSIREAREDFRTGRVFTHHEVFGRIE